MEMSNTLNAYMPSALRAHQPNPSVYEDMHPERKRINRSARRDRRPVRYISPENSVLHTVWEEPSRPYAQRELKDMERRLLRNMYLTNDMASHTSCGHRYYVKYGGVKYKQIHAEDSTGPVNVGNCSVCWKLRQTPNELIPLIEEFITLYEEDCENPEARRTFFAFEVARIFYTWLYREDFNTQ